MKRRNTDCSFCRKNYRDVGPLVEGPGDIYICGECLKLCQSIIEQEKRRRNPPSSAICPEAVRGILDRIVTGQEEAKAAPAEESRVIEGEVSSAQKAETKQDTSV